MTYKNLYIATILILICLAGAAFYTLAGWWWMLVPIVIFLAFISWGAANIRSGFFLKVYSSLPGKKELAITFDDGPHPNTLEILKVLKEYQAKATFFCVGEQVETHPGIFKKIVDDGHEPANHTYSHSHKWGWLSQKNSSEEIEKCTAVLEKYSSKKITFFRPPFGVTNPKIARALQLTRLKTIGWDLRSLDTAIKDPDRLWRRIQSKLNEASIILFHDTQPQTVEVLRKTLEYCRSNGIKIVSLPSNFNN